MEDNIMQQKPPIYLLIVIFYPWRVELTGVLILYAASRFGCVYIEHSFGYARKIL